jgi:hypothetical protein
MGSQELWEPLSQALPPLSPSHEAENFLVERTPLTPINGSRGCPRRFVPARHVVEVSVRSNTVHRKDDSRLQRTFIPRGGHVERRLRQLVRPTAEEDVRSELAGSPPSPSLAQKEILFSPALSPPPALHLPTATPRFSDRLVGSASSENPNQGADAVGEADTYMANLSSGQEYVKPFADEIASDALGLESFDLPFLSQDSRTCDSLDFLLQDGCLSELDDTCPAAEELLATFTPN